MAGTGTLAAGLTCGAVEVEVDLPGARSHQPEGAGEEGRVVSRGLHGVRAGRMFCGFAGQRCRRDSDGSNRGAGAANLNGGDARNHVGRADGDEELVRSGIHLLVNILAPDVGVRGEGKCKGDEAKPKRLAAPAVHRRTPRIQ